MLKINHIDGRIVVMPLQDDEWSLIAREGQSVTKNTELGLNHDSLVDLVFFGRKMGYLFVRLSASTISDRTVFDGKVIQFKTLIELKKYIGTINEELFQSCESVNWKK